MYIQNKFIFYASLAISLSLLLLTPYSLHASSLDEEILEKIQELKRMENAIHYDQEIISTVDSPKRAGTVADKSTSYTNSATIDHREYIIYSNAPIKNIRIRNSGHLSSRSNIFSGFWNPTTGLVYIENMGTLLNKGTHYNEYGIWSLSRNLFLQNTGQIFNTEHSPAPINIRTSDTAILRNNGHIESHNFNGAIYAQSAKNMIFLNLEGGEIIGKATALNLRGENIKFENKGNISGQNINIIAQNKLDFKNIGKIKSDVILTSQEVSNIDLQKGKLEGNLSATASTITILLSDENEITGNINIQSDSSRLILFDQNKVLSSDKYNNFEYLDIYGSWELTAKNWQFKDITVHSSANLITYRNTTLEGNLINQGTLVLKQSELNNNSALEISGHYTGENGNIEIDIPIINYTDQSRMIIRGEARGTTSIILKTPPNSTLKSPLKLIQTSKSTNDSFYLSPRRKNKYRLKLVNENTGNNWYLIQDSIIPAHILSHLANLDANQNLFFLKFSDRYLSLVNTSRQKFWVMYTNKQGHYSIEQAEGHIDTNKNTLQMANQLLHYNGKNYGINFGLILNIGSQKSKVFNEAITTIKTTGLGLGLYANYLKENHYFDSYLVMNQFTHKLSTNEENTHYKSKNIQFSLEYGIHYPILNNALNIQIEEQLIYSHLKMPLWIKEIKHKNQLKNRLGIKLNYVIPTLNLQSYLEFNWFHKFNNSYLTSENKNYKIAGGKNTKEFALMLTNSPSKHWNIQLRTAYHFGKHHWKEIYLATNISYLF
ncbi:autotransporter domain-containing protein [Avibacterium paragallinarum]|uniref:autotransporter domain-containing protein n=1 Tax=Avibacterium paragallinarum TaxID=728 RepID=UPI0021F6A756|nr:autotransporter domain-containing protein [Avibacterium paragallinarum]UXN36875.1 autotransporter domain-containing protein [Avibacterium paragallinarum]